MKTALITGITGQDGSYLAELLLSKGYRVVGMVSQDFAIGEDNIAGFKDRLNLEVGDLLDFASMKRIMESYRPDEIYNLAGITFVPKSWDSPTLTLDINTLGVARIMELLVSILPDSRFYQASSAKMYKKDQTLISETSPTHPTDPYGVSKAAAHDLVRLFREKHNLFAVSGILFNHESPRRGVEFVTRKITKAAVEISKGLSDKVSLGNMAAKEDWGYAPDYVEAMWMMLQQEKPEDFVVATGQLHTVEDICQIAFSHLNLDYKSFVHTDPNLVRQASQPPQADISKAKRVLGWQPKVSFEDMIVEMVEYDLSLLSSSHTN